MPYYVQVSFIIPLLIAVTTLVLFRSRPQQGTIFLVVGLLIWAIWLGRNAGSLNPALENTERHVDLTEKKNIDRLAAKATPIVEKALDVLSKSKYMLHSLQYDFRYSPTQGDENWWRIFRYVPEIEAWLMGLQTRLANRTFPDFQLGDDLSTVLRLDLGKLQRDELYLESIYARFAPVHWRQESWHGPK